MKLAILEDRPWIIMNTIKKIESITQMEEISLLYYANSLQKTNDNGQNIISECELLGIKLISITENNFESKMNELYCDKERIFFFDLVLDDNSDFFEERINVIYAKERKKDNRIWFYTTSGKYNISKIKKMFGNQYIPVIDYDVKEDALVFKEDTLKKILIKE